MTVAEFALNLGLITHFSLETLYIDKLNTFIEKFSNNENESVAGRAHSKHLESILKKDAISFMCNYLGDFNSVDLDPETEIMIYIIENHQNLKMV